SAPRGAPGLSPLCRRQRVRLLMAGDLQDPPDRVLAPQRGARLKFASLVSVPWFMRLIKNLHYPLFSIRPLACMRHPDPWSRPLPWTVWRPDLGPMLHMGARACRAEIAAGRPSPMPLWRWEAVPHLPPGPPQIARFELYSGRPASTSFIQIFGARGMYSV